MTDFREIEKSSRNLMRYAIVVAVFLTLVTMMQNGIIELPYEQVVEEKMDVAETTTPEIGSIDDESGLVVDEGFEVVKVQCGACHSTKLVTQNRFSREGWKSLIVWMQETQNLWDLGENQGIILDYLEKHLAPKKMGRRKRLENIEWYALEE